MSFHQQEESLDQLLILLYRTHRSVLVRDLLCKGFSIVSIRDAVHVSGAVFDSDEQGYSIIHF